MSRFLQPSASFWFPPLITGAITGALAFLIWLRRPSRPAVTLGLYLCSVAVWCIGYGVQLLVPALQQKVICSKVQYLGHAGVALTGLIFVLQYTGFDDWISGRRIFLLSVIPSVTQILVWTNEKHGWIWRRVWLETGGPYPLMARIHGPWFWIFLAYSYGLCLTAILLLFRSLFSRRGIYRSQAAVLLIGCLIPFACNLMYSFGANPIPNLDLTVFAFSVTGLSMAWGLFRFQLPVIMPIARQTVFEGMSDAVVAIDIGGNVVEVNPVAARILDRPANSLIGQPAVAALGQYPALADFCARPREAAAQIAIESAGFSQRFDARCSLLKNDRQRTVGSLIVLRDVTEREAAEAALREAHADLERRIDERTVDLSRTIAELRLLEDQLSFSACHDSLTGLANRRLFLDRVARRLEAASPDQAAFAILYVDLDRFKVYNDGYGHHLGDLILVEMGRRLKTCLGTCDTVARMGGDEFTVLLDRVRNVDEASRIAQDCLRALANPAHIGGCDIDLTCSIGISVGSSRQRTAEELVRDADLAMYRAKRGGGNRVLFFGESMRSTALSLVQLEHDLRNAVSRGEMVVQYQPFVRFATGKVVGFEALVRWRHPERGLLQPADFLPVAEQSGLLMGIDEFVLGEACRQRAVWDRVKLAGAEPAFVSINVSGWQFSHPHRWWQALAANGNGAGLRLEMVESVLAANAHAAIEFFAELRAHNLEVYLDDFGTGYSSLSRLSHFPIRSLKIDRSFVKDLVTGGKDISIVRAIIALAHSLEMEVVAEGVECQRQSEILQDLGCEYGQGFYFSPPVDGAATLAMLNS